MRNKIRLVFTVALFAVTAFFAVENGSKPYSQARIMSKSEQILSDGSQSDLLKWLSHDKRVSIDTLIAISSGNISPFDTVRSAIFNGISEIKDPNILQLMGIKISNGNPVEKIIASTYVYLYYGVEMRLEKHMPLASDLILFHSTANALRDGILPFDASAQRMSELAATFPGSKRLYREFILNRELSCSVRKWFVESMPKNPECEDTNAFLQDLHLNLSEDDPLFNALNETRKQIFPHTFENI